LRKDASRGALLEHYLYKSSDVCSNPECTGKDVETKRDSFPNLHSPHLDLNMRLAYSIAAAAAASAAFSMLAPSYFDTSNDSDQHASHTSSTGGHEDAQSARSASESGTFIVEDDNSSIHSELAPHDLAPESTYHPNTPNRTIATDGVNAGPRNFARAHLSEGKYPNVTITRDSTTHDESKPSATVQDR
jgi:hypothetical protein